MRKFFQNLRKNDRGDQVVGWILLASIIAIVGGVTWANIADDLDPILNAVEDATQATSDRFAGN
jgi:hypothetical protein